MENLSTPFGEIKIFMDGKEVPYASREIGKTDVRCPHVLGRYQISVSFVPDGKKHDIACVFEPSCSYERTPESGERLECQSFYNDQRYKMSIGLEGEAGYIGGMRASGKYDYDVEYLENGMAYIVLPETRTQRYVIGIAWIDDVGRDGPADDDNDRDTETWYAADPTSAL